jgi:hypothetical protein
LNCARGAVGCSSRGRDNRMGQQAQSTPGHLSVGQNSCLDLSCSEWKAEQHGKQRWLAACVLCSFGQGVLSVSVVS